MPPIREMKREELAAQALKHGVLDASNRHFKAEAEGFPGPDSELISHSIAVEILRKHARPARRDKRGGVIPQPGGGVPHDIYEELAPRGTRVHQPSQVAVEQLLDALKGSAFVPHPATGELEKLGPFQDFAEFESHALRLLGIPAPVPAEVAEELKEILAGREHDHALVNAANRRLKQAKEQHIAQLFLTHLRQMKEPNADKAFNDALQAFDIVNRLSPENRQALMKALPRHEDLTIEKVREVTDGIRDSTSRLASALSDVTAVETGIADVPTKGLAEYSEDELEKIKSIVESAALAVTKSDSSLDSARAQLSHHSAFKALGAANARLRKRLETLKELADRIEKEKAKPERAAPKPPLPAPREEAPPAPPEFKILPVPPKPPEAEILPVPPEAPEIPRILPLPAPEEKPAFRILPIPAPVEAAPPALTDVERIIFIERLRAQFERGEPTITLSDREKADRKLVQDVHRLIEEHGKLTLQQEIGALKNDVLKRISETHADSLALKKSFSDAWLSPRDVDHVNRLENELESFKARIEKESEAVKIAELEEDSAWPMILEHLGDMKRYRDQAYGNLAPYAGKILNWKAFDEKAYADQNLENLFGEDRPPELENLKEELRVRQVFATRAELAKFIIEAEKKRAAVEALPPEKPVLAAALPAKPEPERPAVPSAMPEAPPARPPPEERPPTAPEEERAFEPGVEDLPLGALAGLREDVSEEAITGITPSIAMAFSNEEVAELKKNVKSDADIEKRFEAYEKKITTLAKEIRAMEDRIKAVDTSHRDEVDSLKQEFREKYLSLAKAFAIVQAELGAKQRKEDDLADALPKTLPGSIELARDSVSRAASLFEQKGIPKKSLVPEKTFKYLDQLVQHNHRIEKIQAEKLLHAVFDHIRDVASVVSKTAAKPEAVKALEETIKKFTSYPPTASREDLRDAINRVQDFKEGATSSLMQARAQLSILSTFERGMSPEAKALLDSGFPAVRASAEQRVNELSRMIDKSLDVTRLVDDAVSQRAEVDKRLEAERRGEEMRKHDERRAAQLADIFKREVSAIEIKLDPLSSLKSESVSDSSFEQLLGFERSISDLGKVIAGKKQALGKDYLEMSRLHDLLAARLARVYPTLFDFDSQPVKWDAYRPDASLKENIDAVLPPVSPARKAAFAAFAARQLGAEEKALAEQKLEKPAFARLLHEFRQRVPMPRGPPAPPKPPEVPPATMPPADRAETEKRLMRAFGFKPEEPAAPPEAPEALPKPPVKPGIDVAPLLKSISETSDLIKKTDKAGGLSIALHRIAMHKADVDRSGNAVVKARFDQLRQEFLSSMGRFFRFRGRQVSWKWYNAGMNVREYLKSAMPFHAEIKDFDRVAAAAAAQAPSDVLSIALALQRIERGEIALPKPASPETAAFMSEIEKAASLLPSAASIPQFGEAFLPLWRVKDRIPDAEPAVKARHAKVLGQLMQKISLTVLLDGKEVDYGSFDPFAPKDQVEANLARVFARHVAMPYYQELAARLKTIGPSDAISLAQEVVRFQQELDSRGRESIEIFNRLPPDALSYQYEAWGIAPPDPGIAARQLARGDKLNEMRKLKDISDSWQLLDDRQKIAMTARLERVFGLRGVRIFTLANEDTYHPKQLHEYNNALLAGLSRDQLEQVKQLLGEDPTRPGTRVLPTRVLKAMSEVLPKKPPAGPPKPPASPPSPPAAPSIARFALPPKGREARGTPIREAGKPGAKPREEKREEEQISEEPAEFEEARDAEVRDKIAALRGKSMPRDELAAALRELGLVDEEVEALLGPAEGFKPMLKNDEYLVNFWARTVASLSKPGAKPASTGQLQAYLGTMKDLEARLTPRYSAGHPRVAELRSLINAVEKLIKARQSQP
jgi:hypothetical protein